MTMNESEQQERINRFSEKLKEATEETQISVVAKISPDGPTFQYVDLKANQEQPQGESEQGAGEDN